MSNLTVRDATRDLMRGLGLTTVFGNPGSTEVAFLRDWPNDFRYVLGLQESVVVAMADGYAQVRGDAVLVNLHSAGGVGHALGQVFTASRNRTPLIILAGQQVRPLLPGDPFLGATDAAGFPKPYVKWSCEPARAADVPAAIARAYHISTQAPFGPTFVSVPADDWDAEAAPVSVRPRIAGFAPDPDALRQLATALRASTRPGLVVGADVDADGAVAEVVALAERTKAGVWAAPMSSRCSFPEDHPQFLGFLQPEQRSIAASLRRHDLVLVLGAPVFTHHVFHGVAELPLPELFLVSDDEDVLARAAQGVGIRATPRLTITGLAELVGEPDRVAPRPAPRPAPPPATSPISADYVFATLSRLLPEQAIVVEEAPSHRNAMHDHLPIRSLATGFLTTASGSLGYGLPAAVGAGLASQGRKVVAVLGDGSSMYGIQALWTAAREHVPVTFVILDNAEYAAVRLLAESADGAKVPGVELGGIDFVTLASSLGCEATAVARAEDLNRVLAESIAVDDRPTLVHVRVGQASRPLY